MLIETDGIWRSPDLAPAMAQRRAGLVVRMQYRITKLIATGDSRYWRVGSKKFWGPVGAPIPVTWSEFGADVIAWSVKRPVEVKEAA